MLNRQIKSKLYEVNKTTANENTHISYMTRETRNKDLSKEKNRDKSKVSTNLNTTKRPLKVSLNLDKTTNNINKINSTPKQTPMNITNTNKRPNNIKQALYNEMVNLNENNHKRNKNSNQLYTSNKVHNAGKSTTQSTSFLVNSNTNNTKPSVSQSKTNTLVNTAVKENSLKTNILIKSINEENNTLQQTIKTNSNCRDLSNQHYETNNSKMINNIDLSSTRKDKNNRNESKQTFSPSLGKKTLTALKNPIQSKKSTIQKTFSNLNDTFSKSKPSHSNNKTSTKSTSNSIKKDYTNLFLPNRKKMPSNLNYSVNRSKEKSAHKDTNKQIFNMTVVDSKNKKTIVSSLTNTISPKNKLSHMNINSHTSSAIKTSGNNFNTNTNINDEKQNIIDKNFILEKYSKVLKDNEIDEIKQAKEIYFLGTIPKRVIKENTFDNINIDDRESNGASNMDESSSMMQSINNSKVTAKSNNDEIGNFIVNKGDHIIYRYEIINELGRGSFGQALKCIDHKYNKQCCVKIIKNNKKFISQAKIEIKILKYIRNADPKNEANIVKVYDSFVFRNHICIVFELLDLNLYEFLKNQDFKGMDLSVIRKIAVQLLYTLIFLKKHSIIHCDLKLENILLRKNGKTGIKVIDFGSSCFENEKLYSYIQSRFYRAPEVILGIGYGIEIDMWSFGCVMAELYNGIPIFPGENERDQLNYMMEYLGVPSQEIILYSKKRSHFFDENLVPLQIPNSRGKIRMPNTKKIERFLRGADPKFIDFVSKCLIYDPIERISPDDAILHPWIISGIPKEILTFHKSLIEQNRNNQAEKQARSLDKVKPMSEIKNKSKSNFLAYQTHSKKIVSQNNFTTEKRLLNTKSKSDNSFANKTK